MNDTTKNLSENGSVEQQNEKKMEIFEEETEDEDFTHKNIWPQVWNACLANGIALSTGINTGFSTVFIAQLIADPNIKEFSANEASWLTSLAVLNGPIGALCIGPIMDRVGRKKAMMFANTLPILCWTLTYSVTDSIWPLYIARIVGGAAGAMTSCVGIYTSEICHPRVRDVMLILIGAFVSVGTLITMVVGSYLEWHTAALCLALISTLCFFVSFILPESPLWLVSFRPTQERLNQALRLTRYFNRSQKLYEKECARIKEIYANTKKSSTIQKKKSSVQKWFIKNAQLFTEEEVYKPMLIIMTIFFFWSYCGFFVVLMYSANVFKAIGSHFGSFNEYTATIIIGAVKAIMTILSALASVKYGRRELLIVSCLGMAVTITISGLLQSFSNSTLNFSKSSSNTIIEDSDNANAIISILTVISLILFVLFGSLAMTNIPWALANELLPTRAKAIGSSLTTSFSSLIMFSLLKSTPFVLEYITLSTMFYIFGIISVIAAVFIYKKLPETLGRTLEEIEQYFIPKQNTKAGNGLKQERALLG